MNLGDALPDVIPSVDGLVLRVLARSGLEMSGRQVADAAGASPERVRQVLNRLAEVGLVSLRRRGTFVYYAANRDHLLWPAVQHLVVTADQVVRLLKQRLAAAVDNLIAEGDEAARISLALFGSVARGDARPDSDIDILLITPDELPPGDVEALVATIVDTATTATGNACAVYAATRSRIDELVAERDPMIPAWTSDAATFHGPDVRRRLLGAPWDAPVA